LLLLTELHPSARYIDPACHAVGQKIFSLMGQPTELEGKRAVLLPLRFDDGVVSLGPLKLGVTPSLF